jgi:hypothetical protein
MYQGRYQHEHNLSHKNYVRFHCYRIIWFTFIWNKILSDNRRFPICQEPFKTALWFWISIQRIPPLGSDMTLTFNTGTSCWFLWSEVGGRGLLSVLPQPEDNDLLDDVHRGRKGSSWIIQPETNGIPWHLDTQIPQQCFSTAVNKYPWSYEQLTITAHLLIYATFRTMHRL